MYLQLMIFIMSIFLTRFKSVFFPDAFPIEVVGRNIFTYIESINWCYVDNLVSIFIRLACDNKRHCHGSLTWETFLMCLFNNCMELYRSKPCVKSKVSPLIIVWLSIQLLNVTAVYILLLGLADVEQNKVFKGIKAIFCSIAWRHN